MTIISRLFVDASRLEEGLSACHVQTGLLHTDFSDPMIGLAVVELMHLLLA